MAPVPVVHQSIVPPALRGFTAGLMLTVSSVLGLGLGPLLTGVISDLFMTRNHGENSLRYAIGIALVMTLPAAFAYWRAAHHLQHELRRA